MRTNGKRAARQYLQSEGNLALADEGLGLAQHSKRRHLSPVMGVARGLPEKQLTVSDVLPVRLIIALVGLSLMLGCLIVLTLYWIHYRL